MATNAAMREILGVKMFVLSSVSTMSGTSHLAARGDCDPVAPMTFAPQARAVRAISMRERVRPELEFISATSFGPIIDAAMIS